jgi:hypothetical protein
MGVSVPKQDKLLILCKWLKIAPEGLLFGTPPSTSLDKCIAEENITLIDQQLIVKYLLLKCEQKRVVREIVDGLVALHPENQ